MKGSTGRTGLRLSSVGQALASRDVFALGCDWLPCGKGRDFRADSPQGASNFALQLGNSGLGIDRQIRGFTAVLDGFPFLVSMSNYARIMLMPNTSNGAVSASAVFRSTTSVLAAVTSAILYAEAALSFSAEASTTVSAACSANARFT